VISVNETLNPVFERPVKNAGLVDRMTSLRALGKSLTLPVGDFYTAAELEEELLRIGEIQRNEGAELIVVACTLISALLLPGALERIRKQLGIPMLDPQPIALKTGELLAGL